jgi:hypothetical protein
MLKKLMEKLGYKKIEKEVTVNTVVDKTKEKPSAVVALASDAQKELYKKLVNTKSRAMAIEGIIPLTDKELDVISKSDLSAKIARLQTLTVAFPMTEKQKELIIQLCERNGLPLPNNFENMSSSEASLFIDKINAYQHSKPALATDKQIDRIKLYISAGLIDPNKVDLLKITKQEASELIESLEDAYRNWRDNHITDAQITYIQQLQERLGDVVLSKEELQVMPRKTASALIDQLSKEWKERDGYAKSYVVNYKDLTDRSKEREMLMKLSIAERELEEKIKFINKLYILLGQQPEDEELVDFNTVDQVLTNMLALARMYVSDEEIESTLGIDIEEIPAEA